MNFSRFLGLSILYYACKLDSCEKIETPQKNHNNAETKPGQDTEGQCSNAELIGRLTMLVSVFTS